MQLATKYNCSTKTIQRLADSIAINKQTAFSKEVILLMDTTYFGRRFGVMVFKDSLTGIVLYKVYVKQETNALYLSGIKENQLGAEVTSVPAFFPDW